MSVDMRREHAYQQRMMRDLQGHIGETVLWFRFDVSGSQYHDVYDEGNKQYLPPLLIPFMWLDQVEDPKQYTDVGRRPTMRLRGAVATEQALEAGLPISEVHGERSWDIRPEPPTGQDGRPASPWMDDRLNDVLYYDGRFWDVSNFQIRGRTQTGDNIIGVSAIETKHDELVRDIFPFDQPSDLTVPPEEP